jgi:large subunit ribosomal protein L24e
MVSCSFCSEEITKGTGMMYAKKDGTLFYFCSSKCRKNLLGLGREGRLHKWTDSARKYKTRVDAKKK